MIIDAPRIEGLISGECNPTERETIAILDKAEKMDGLNLEECALLIGAAREPFLFQTIMEAAAGVKEAGFGKRVVLFAPLYLTNECVNNCLYCGFRKDNRQSSRIALSIDEAVKEAKELQEKGFKRLLLVAGESPKSSSADRIASYVKAIYEKSAIRIIHLNAAPMPLESLEKLKKTGIGVFQVFQETYHRQTYERMHPSGPKADYARRLNALDCAIEAGFDDLGIGALLGLYDWRFEVLSVIAHSRHFYSRYGLWPHTISVPRLQPAAGSPLSSAPYPVSDDEFKLIVALYRLAVPAAGVVVSTREPATLRNEVLSIGASQISAGSRTDPGGYSKDSTQADAAQFFTSDHRSLDEMVEHIASTGYVPSLCTSCYRTGRTGKVFSSKVSHGEIKKYCLPNAILTMKEYILDNANGSREICEKVIEKNIESIDDDNLRAATLKKLKRIEAGKRDLFF